MTIATLLVGARIVEVGVSAGGVAVTPGAGTRAAVGVAVDVGGEVSVGSSGAWVPVGVGWAPGTGVGVTKGPDVTGGVGTVPPTLALTITTWVSLPQPPSSSQTVMVTV